MAEETLTLFATDHKPGRNCTATANLPPAERLSRQSSVEPGGCVIFTGHIIRSTGYGQISIRRQRWSTHRLAWTLAHGQIPGGLSVLHRCDNRACMNVDHLFLGTQADNMLDMAQKGRSVRGEASFRAKLTEDQVIAIRNDPRSHRAIARDYGLRHTSVGDIKRRRIWRHI